MGFEQLFGRAFAEQREPYPFQREFAEAAELPGVVRVPTGLGKTAMVVLGWLWRRFEAPTSIRDATARRLVYCLPMRTLVEQTACEARKWVEALDLQVKVHVLMGGETAEDWDLAPEEPAILIGTQDMLLSRALNRGYAMSRYRWPLPFGLLNNDCLWVLDEVQLMDVGLSTSAQMEGFRRDMRAIGPTQSVWMSATLRESWLETVDLPKGPSGDRLELGDEDLENPRIRKLWQAPKPLSKAEAPMGEAKACAEAVAEAHRAGTKTLAVFNTVKRAREVYERLLKLKRPDLPCIVLIHSRFRREDRDAHLKELLNGKDVIAVATQVVEAGVDVSATTLLTELAPWASLVQRFGRCNRRGDDSQATVRWFDPGELDDKFKDALPYEVDDLREARRRLLSCEDVSLQALEELAVETPLDAAHVIRRRDLIDLFDTTPDLAGNDIDVSRFIRSGDEHDVQAFWRDFEGAPEEKTPRRDELCSVPVGDFKKFRGDHREDVWRWDGLEAAWRKVADREVYPGQIYLVRAAAGGYDSGVGWNPKSAEVAVLKSSGEEPDANSRDFQDGPWLSIAEHTEDVVAELNKILALLDIDDVWKQELREAARWHDWGKAHKAFQAAVKDEGRPPEWEGRRDIGKARKGFWKPYSKSRRAVRHELASALGMLAAGKSDLSVYLAAAHHGKVRLSIRSLPNEKRPDRSGPDGADVLYARGVWDGDELAGVDLGGGVTAPAATLSLECMQMGRAADGSPSWTERMLRLRDELGPFRLAYLEALLRAADMRASRDEAKRDAEGRDAEGSNG